MTTRRSVVIISNIKAELLLDERRNIADDRFVEVVVWQVKQPVRGSAHLYRYRLAFVVMGICVLRYDNEAGKGDHRHTRARESAYGFDSPDKLIHDFLRDVRRIHREDSDS